MMNRKRESEIVQDQSYDPGQYLVTQSVAYVSHKNYLSFNVFRLVKFLIYLNFGDKLGIVRATAFNS